MIAPGSGAAELRQWVLEPACEAVPVIACVPHGGRLFPMELRSELAVDPATLWADWLTRELYGFLPGLGITTITTTFSRFVADVNRDPTGEQHGSFWSSVVAAQTAGGRPVYRRALTQAEISHRIRLVHEPFHRSLDEAIERLLARFARLLVLDLHSFGRPLDGDVILGDRHGLTARPDTVGLLSEKFSSNGFRVRVNERYSGGWTVRRFADQSRVDAVQVELNQRRYLRLGTESRTPPPVGDFDAAQRLLREVLSAVVRLF